MQAALGERQSFEDARIYQEELTRLGFGRALWRSDTSIEIGDVALLGMSSSLFSLHPTRKPFSNPLP